jgi:predicted aldo/keto reductase-like oxidoreductase
MDIDDLAAMAQLLKKEGKIKAWGLAFMRSQQHLHQAYLDKFDVLQFDNSPGVAEYDAVVANRATKANVIFSPLRGGPAALTPAEKLNKLFDDFPRSVILCSMFNERHLKENAALLNGK